MSTRIIHNPKGDRANVLREWAYLYMTMLMDKQARVLQVKYPSNNKLLLTIAEVGLKKVATLAQLPVTFQLEHITNVQSVKKLIAQHLTGSILSSKLQMEQGPCHLQP